MAVFARSAGRAVALAFWPAAAFTGLLRYALKFMVVGAVLIVPMVSVALVYVDELSKGIQSTARERQGVEFIGPLTALTTHLVNARHEVVVSGGTARPDLGTDLARIDQLDRRLGATLGTRADWRSTRRSIEAAGQASDGLLDRVRIYDFAADALLAFVLRVGDQSGLTLDRDLDSYYLMEIVQNQLPLLLDVVGRATDRASFADSRTLPTDADAFIQLGVYNGMVSSAQKAIKRAARTIAERTADDTVRRVVQSHFARLDVVTSAFGRQLQETVRARRVGAAFANGADSVRSEATYFAADSAMALDRLLLARIAALSARTQRVQYGTSVAAGLAIYLFVGFYLSMASPIRRIVAVLHAVADGDLTRRVTVNTRDEVSYVARALNDTIAKMEIATNRLGRQASHDTLTGLPNRASVLRRLDEALDRTRRGDSPPMAVLFIDLDKFKIINDSLGHAAGDTVLRTVAERLARAVRPTDLVARLAGDEFLVIAEGLDRPDEAKRVAEGIVQEVSRPITITTQDGTRDVNVGGSVGIAFADGAKASSADDLLRDADVAMYKAKERGRGRVEIFDDEMFTAIESRLEIQGDLRSAIDTEQIQVHYQPIVDMADGRVVCLEALVRWDHPTRGMVDARELVALAEDTGVINALGAAVLGRACQQAAQWRAARQGCANLRVAVNVSGKQFSEPAFIPTVAAVLTGTGLDPNALWLEITETSIMADTANTRATVDAVRALGVHLAIDDFGTGYSSLAYLRRFPVDVVKIDQSFVSGLGDDPQAEAIVAMIVGLADALHMRVVAEGVENADQLERLRRLGCTAAQGFYLCEPAPAEQIWEQIERRAWLFTPDATTATHAA
jgi:diguanylate cyclase (GGDEF)-like protein